MSAKPVALILGAGPRVGSAVAKKLASSGYSVAVASRKGTDSRNDEGFLAIKADLAQPTSVKTAFDAVKAEFGASPSLVVYNAATLTPPPVQGLILSIPSERLASDLNVNTVSPFAAAQQAVEGWATLPPDAAKVFIYTGNISNVKIVPVPLTVTLGVGKSASSYWLGMADNIYSGQGYRFFYADERNVDGSIKGLALDGDAHAEFYAKLATGAKDVPWHATFVKDQGYTKF
ncbi:NAD(P)-binding protein [Thozetella sp. PMI_491]|nr:NAD(P)-binding protein [Thozetella sp. PMI_491]